MKVRDPSAVRVQIDAGKGMTTILAEGSEEAEVPLPDTSPPFTAGFREATTLRRRPDGPIDARCDKCDPEVKTVVGLDGVLSFGSKFHVASFDWTQKEMRIHLRDTRDASFGSPSSFDAEVVTPWTNVVEVRRVSKPDRYLGTKLSLSGLIGATLGGFALGDGVANHHPATTAFGAIILPIAGILGIGGAWYLIAPPVDQVLFGERARATPAGAAR